MARSSWHFTMSDDLRDWISQQEEKVWDWTPVMVLISEDMARFVRDTVIPTGGEGKWAPLAASTIKRDKWKDRASSGRPGRIGILQSTGWMRQRTYRDASPVNAAVINDAPHGHLNQYGKRNRDSEAFYQKGGKRIRSKSQIRSERPAEGGTMSPPRFFVYIEESRVDTLYPMWILDYFFTEGAD